MPRLPSEPDAALADEPAAPPEDETRKKILGLAAFLAVVAVTALLIWLTPDLRGLEGYGYLGIYVTSAVATASVLFPGPGVLVAGVAGTVLNPLLVGLFGGLGAATGELTGFVAGYGGRMALQNRQSPLLARIESWMRHRGFVTLIGLSAIPNPVFDLAGLVAGSLRYPLWKFLIAVAIGSCIKYVAIATLGNTLAAFIPWL